MIDDLASIPVVEHVLPSGLVVRDYRSRAFPRDVSPDGDEPGVTATPLSTVNVGTPPDETNVMWDVNGVPPPGVQGWAGWPVEWATPTWGSMVGLGEITRRVSTLFAAIDKQAWQISTMPPYRTRGGEIVSSLAWMRNPQPEVYTGWIEAARQVMFSFLGSGEVFLWATERFRPSGRVASWVMLNPGWMTVELDGTLRRYFLGGKELTGDVLHIRYASWPGDARGHGPLEAAANTLFGAAALERYGAQLAVRGGVPWAVLSASQARLTANQAAGLQQQYVAARMSAMGAPAVLSGGLTLTPVNISPRDMALLELRQFDEARLAVLLGVPPFLLGLPSGGDSLTYSTTESFYDFHWRSALRPFAAMLTEAIGNWALANSDEALELNRDEYTRPGFGERVAAYAALHGIVDENGPAISIEEIRKAERLSKTGAVSPASTSLAVPE